MSTDVPDITTPAPTNNMAAAFEKAKKGKKAKDPDAGPAVVQPLNPMQWQELLAKAGRTHWRVIRITIQLRDKLFAGKPRDLNVANAMLKARDLEDQIEAVPLTQPERSIEAERVATNEGLCEFHRRPGKQGIWFPTNNVKAWFKENWSVLGMRSKNWGSKATLAEGMFIYADRPDAEINNPMSAEDDYIYLGEAPDGIEANVCHSEVRGERFSSIKRNEFIQGRTFSFLIKIAKELAHKVPNEDLAAVFLHGENHGLGASRSQGQGKFSIMNMEDVAV